MRAVCCGRVCLEYLRAWAGLLPVTYACFHYPCAPSYEMSMYGIVSMFLSHPFCHVVAVSNQIAATGNFLSNGYSDPSVWCADICTWYMGTEVRPVYTDQY